MERSGRYNLRVQMKPYLPSLIMAVAIGACAPPDSDVTDASTSENTVRMVGGEVLQIVGPLAFRADGDLSPLGQDIERTIELWGLKPIGTSQQFEDEIAEFLRAFLMRDGVRAICLERIQLSETHSVAECRIGETTIQEELLRRSLVLEDCVLTKNRYDTCG